MPTSSFKNTHQAAKPTLRASSDKLALAVLVMGLVFVLFSSHFPTRPLRAGGMALAAVNSGEPSLAGSGFAINAVWSGVAAPPPVSGVELYGSAVNGDASTGVIRSRWYRPQPSFLLLLAGYPLGHGCELFIETDTPGAGIQPLRLALDQNPENWTLQRVSLRGHEAATRFRIVGVDASEKPMGWVGFSQPFVLQTHDRREWLKQGLLLTLCLAASLAVVFGSGIALRSRFAPAASAVWIPVPGIALLAGIGLLAWKGPASISPEAICRFCLAAILLALVYAFAKRPLSTCLSRAESRVLVTILVLVCIALAKSIYSVGVSGELYQGRISRTLEASNRSDSRIPYHVVQLVGLRESGYSSLGQALFEPWNFSHRGPMAGLAASPLVLCMNPKLPSGRPDAAWTLFDPEGFASFRTILIVLYAGSLFIAFGLARLFCSEEWAILAFLCVAAAPFTIHELYFTWPKVPAGAFVLLAAYLSLTRRFLPAGLALGVGYLFHPSALLCFPGVLFLIALVEVRRANSLSLLYRCIRTAWPVILLCLGLGAVIGLWRRANRGHFHQDSFLDYFRSAGELAPTLVNWLHYRATTALDTLVPLWLYIFHRTDPALLPPDRLLQPWVQFVEQYWCTLAFAGGSVFYFCLLRLTGISVLRARAWLLLVLAPPLVLFIIYFGAPNTGLMREGLHGWFFGYIIFNVVIWQKHHATSVLFWRFASFALLLRGVETLFVLIPVVSWSRGYVLMAPFEVSDFVALSVMFLGTVILTATSVSCCRRLGECAVLEPR